MLPTSTAIQMTYLFKRVMPREGREGLWDEVSWESYRQVIESHALCGWRFVQAIPTEVGDATTAGARGYDLVF